MIPLRFETLLGQLRGISFPISAPSDKRYEKWLEGNEVSRYLIEWTGRYICYDYSLIEEELKRKKEKAKLKATSSSDFKKISRPGIWLRNPEIFRQEKIITRQNAKRLIGVLDEEGYFVKNSLHCTILKDKSYSLKYILGLINSRLLDLWFQDKIGRTGEVFSQMKIAYIEELPIRAINFSDPSDRSRHDRMVELVDGTLSLHKELTAAKTNYEKTTLKRQINAMEWRIDQLVYELYGLSTDETKVVRNST